MAQIYQHYRGGLYEVICVAVARGDMQRVVVYKSLSDGAIWTRDLSEFNRKFKKLDGVQSNEKSIKA